MYLSESSESMIPPDPTTPHHTTHRHTHTHTHTHTVCPRYMNNVFCRSISGLKHYLTQKFLTMKYHKSFPGDDATVAILCQNVHHTPAYWWRGDRVMKPITVWGWLGGHDGQRPMGIFGQDAGVTPLLFFEGHSGIFNDHREAGPWFIVSSERRCFLQYSVPITILGR